MAGTSPPSRDQNFRVGALSGFLPLSDELLSTRGQTLPRLIRNRSVTSFGKYQARRPSSIKIDGQDGNEDGESDADEHRPGEGRTPALRRLMSVGAEVLNTPQMRSMRLIGNSNPRYQWEKYWKTEEELKKMKKPIRKYYERNNFLISQYLYIDRLLDSSLTHNLLEEYTHDSNVDIPRTIPEDSAPSDNANGTTNAKTQPSENGVSKPTKVKRTPKNLYKLPDEETPLIPDDASDSSTARRNQIQLPSDDSADSQSRVVIIAIYINMLANLTLLIGKIVVIVLTSSLSVLASLVDAALDFLSTAIVWTTTKLIAHQDAYKYPVGRRRLEPIGVLVFSVVMITAFAQVALQCFNRLTSGDHSVVELSPAAIIIMAGTVVIKFACWLWCRLIKNSSVQALAQDALTDVVFNIFSIIFPLVGYYLQLWPLDALGGLLLSLFVMIQWARTSSQHIRNLTGATASADDRNVLLYLTMRFAKTIKQIQSLQAYHSGDRLNVEVDIVLDGGMRLRDSHDLGESLQYVLESVPCVERAWVHLDYRADNIKAHMEQGE